MPRRFFRKMAAKFRKPSEPWAVGADDPRMDVIREAADVLSDIEFLLPTLRKRLNYAEPASRLHSTAMELAALARELMWIAYPAQRPEAAAQGDPLLALHHRVEYWLERERSEYPGYRYADRRLYQGLDILQLIGLRGTEQRYRNYGLHELLGPDDRIFDVGANCGFLPIYAAYRKQCRAVCIEHNPFLVGIGEEVAKYLEVDDLVSFVGKRFQDWEAEREAFSVVFSMASHHTLDKGLRLGLDEHMRRMSVLMPPGGTLVFESHGKEAGKEEFHRSLEPARQYFDWDGSRILDAGEREFFLMKRK